MGVQCTHSFIVIEASIEYSSFRNKQKKDFKISIKKIYIFKIDLGANLTISGSFKARLNSIDGLKS